MDQARRHSKSGPTVPPRGHESLTALRMLIKGVLLSLGLFLLLALMYTLATAIFGRNSSTVCPYQKVSHGHIKPGAAGERPSVTCNQGFWFDKVLADTLSCQIVRKRCVGGWERRSCDETWLFTTVSLAKAALVNGSKDDLRTASQLVDSLCFPGNLPSASQLYELRRERHTDVWAWMRVAVPNATCGVLAMSSLALLVSTAARRGRRLAYAHCQQLRSSPECALDSQEEDSDLAHQPCHTSAHPQH